MIKRDNNYPHPLRGFLLLPTTGLVRGYHGVDRDPFVPEILDQEIDPLVQVEEGESRVWVFYPPGWRHDAYRLYEENLVEGSDLLLSSKNVAREIQRILGANKGPYEILFCEVWDLDSVPASNEVTEATFLGYDVAYPGGDFYSAILNGLFRNPHPDLVADYGLLLNDFGLFMSAKIIPEYIRRFRTLVPSESASRFCIYMYWRNLALDG